MSAASGIVKFGIANKKSQKKYRSGLSALKRELDDAYLGMLEQNESIGCATADDYELIAILEFINNKYDKEFYDVKVKNLYFRGYGEVEDFDYKIKGTIYKCFKLKKNRPYAAISYVSGKPLKIDEELTKKIQSRTIQGEYGEFTALYFEMEYSDFDEL